MPQQSEQSRWTIGLGFGAKTGVADVGSFMPFVIFSMCASRETEGSTNGTNSRVRAPSMNRLNRSLKLCKRRGTFQLE